MTVCCSSKKFAYKKEYEDEGLAKVFPNDFEFRDEAVKMTKLIDNIRSPPGVLQILETVNKLNKNNDSLISDLNKFLKATGMISFDKFQKQRVTLEHSFGSVRYLFDDFVAKNKYHMSGIFQQFFDPARFYFLQKHESNYDSANRFYKTEAYRNALTSFLVEQKPDSSFFIGCMNYENPKSDWLLKQLDILKLEGLLQVMKQLHPIKMPLIDFCRRFSELLTDELRHFDEIGLTRQELPSFAKNIIASSFGNKMVSEVLIGNSKIFMKANLVEKLEHHLAETRRLFEKWAPSLRTKLRNFRTFIVRKRFIAKIRKQKEIAKNSLERMQAKIMFGAKFQLLRKYVSKLQSRFRVKSGIKKLLACLEKLSIFKRRVSALVVRFRYRRTKRMLHNLVSRVKGFLLMQRIRKTLFMRNIIKKTILDKVFQEDRSKTVAICSRAIVKLTMRRFFFAKNKERLNRLREYLYNHVMRTRVITVQSNWRRYCVQKQFKKSVKAIVYVQKNMLRYMWRKNYLKMKYGMIMIQRLFRSKQHFKTPEMYAELLHQSNIRRSLKDKIQTNVHELQEAVWSRFSNRLKQEAKNKPAFKVSRANFFSYIIDVNANENIDEEIANEFTNFLGKLNDVFENTNEELAELSLCDDHAWAFTNSFNSYCWGNCTFIPKFAELAAKKQQMRNNDKQTGQLSKSPVNEKKNGLLKTSLNDTIKSRLDVSRPKIDQLIQTKISVIQDVDRQMLNKLDFYGSKPQFIASGSNFTAFYFRTHNELKYFGNFELYGSKEIIKKRNSFATTKFNNDFLVSQISSNGNTFAILSSAGEALLWPFYNEQKRLNSRVRISFPEKIDEIGCGDGFAVMRTHKGQVFVVSQRNSNGELATDDFSPSHEVKLVSFFNEKKEVVTQIAVGERHILALTLEGALYGWGSNMHGQLANRFGLNYPHPRSIRIPNKDKFGGRVLKISAGKFSSYAITKEQKLFWWGTNGGLSAQRSAIEYKPLFEVF